MRLINQLTQEKIGTEEVQAKLKYRLYGEFSNYEINELIEWFRSEIGVTPQDCKSLKITIDWEPASKDAV